MFHLNFSDKTLLVTGGTRGIGKAITLALLDAGASVLCNFVRNQSAVDALLEEVAAKDDNYRNKLKIIKADMSREKGMEKLLGEIAECAPLHGIVHCAATGIHGKVEDLQLKHFDWTMNLNARAYFHLVSAGLKYLGEGACIIGLSSEGAERAVPNYTLIGSSKAALEAMTRHFAAELACRHIRCNILSPGSVITTSWDAFPDKDRRIAQVKAKIPGGRLTTPEDVASVAVFLLSDLASAINGQTIIVDRGERLVV